jgi:hypothetical protein
MPPRFVLRGAAAQLFKIIIILSIMKTINEALGEMAAKLEATAETHRRSSMFYLYNAAQACHLMGGDEKAGAMLKVMDGVGPLLCYEKTLRDCATMAREFARDCAAGFSAGGVDGGGAGEG